MNTTAGVRVSALYEYPVKSCGRIRVKKAAVDRFGFSRDRRWMLVDENGVFVTQREIPRMALIRPSFRDQQLMLEAPAMPRLNVPAGASGAPRTAIVWRDSVSVLDLGDDSARWATTFLQRSVRLVTIAPDFHRPVDPDYAIGDDYTSLADGFPFLIISEASLMDLNTRIATPLPMNRFRPNIVVSGCAPYAEDRWRRFRIGRCEFVTAKACGRCVITTTDQETGTRRGKEPLRALGRYRKQYNQVIFGQNLIHLNPGFSVSVGAELEILEP